MSGGQFGCPIVFRGNDGETAYFEILMNQFRTIPFIRTKIAVYPNSYSDMLTETRYGDIIKLEHSVTGAREHAICDLFFSF